eukprot:357293-Chlamydomonas_euryale.AAC.3
MHDVMLLLHAVAGPARPCQKVVGRIVGPATGTPRACAAAALPQQQRCELASNVSSDRRAMLLGVASLAAGCLVPQPVHATATAAAAVYEDPVDKFSLPVPPGWALGEGAIGGNTGYQGASGASPAYRTCANAWMHERSFSAPCFGMRRTVAMFPDDPTVDNVNISVTVTNVSGEFTKMGSFGNVDTFAGNLINSLDRSFLLRVKNRSPDEPVQVARLIDYKAVNGGETYQVEYTVQKLPGPVRHLFSTASLGTNGRYNRLYTLTAQCLEDDLPKYQTILQDAVKSFRIQKTL